MNHKYESDYYEGRNDAASGLVSTPKYNNIAYLSGWTSVKELTSVQKGRNVEIGEPFLAIDTGKSLEENTPVKLIQK